MSSFDTWFKQQFGRRVGQGFAFVDDSDLEAKIEAGKAAQAELARRQQWDEMYRAALYANGRWEGGVAGPVEKTVRRQRKDRHWDEYLPGTKAHSYNGGAWLRTDRGWTWNGHTRSPGGTFPTPGADAIGECIELPPNS